MLDNDANPKTLSRLELLKLAQTLRVSDADVMTRAELRAAIERAKRPDPRPSAQPVTWLGVARRLLASIVEQGLHLPDAAALIRGGAQFRPTPSGPPPVATVTLARIYAAQGHLERGIATLEEVLESDPDHDIARELRAQLVTSLAEKRERERLERAAAAVATAPEARGAAAVGGENRPSGPEIELVASSAASDLLSAVPVTQAATAPSAAAPGERASEDEVTLSSGAVEPISVIEPIHGIAPAPAEPSDTEPPSAVEPASAAAPGGDEPGANTPSPGRAEPEAVNEPQRPAGLVLIETSEPNLYLYWELASPAVPVDGNGAAPCWVSVVTHAPRGAGSERRERRFPVQRSAGAVRLEGLPQHVVVRAKLTLGDAAEAPPLVVAGSVWAADVAAIERLEARFLPHAAADPAALAARAGAHLADAAAVYY